MNLKDLTLGQIEELKNYLGTESKSIEKSRTSIDKFYIGKKVIVRTYSAGVHFGEVIDKVGAEVIIKNSRRLYRWHTIKGISLSEVANHGLKSEESKVCEEVDNWFNAIELIVCSEKAIKNIEEQDVYTI